MRVKRSLTQRRLAHDLGISQNYMALESGARNPGLGGRCWPSSDDYGSDGLIGVENRHPVS